MVYLDNAATTYPKPESVYSTMDEVNRFGAFNAGRGSYKAAREAHLIIQDAKQLVAELFAAVGYADIVFTPSITHALNQVLNGLKVDADSVIYISPYEHNAVARTINALSEKYGSQVEILPVRPDLSIDVDKACFQFSVKAPTLVVLTAMSNVTGYVLPVKELFTEAKKYGATTVLDSAQAAGLVELNMKELQSDIVCFAGHKALMGPFGVGGFAIRKDYYLEKVFTGGTGSDSLNLDMPDASPARYEASSPNIIAIAGLRATLQELNIGQHYKRIRELTDYLLDRLTDIYGIHVLGNTEECLGIVSFVMDGYSSDEIGTILDEEYDIAVRTGYHCAPLIHDHLKDKPFNGTVRIGLGIYNTEDDIDVLIDALESL